MPAYCALRDYIRNVWVSGVVCDKGQGALRGVYESGIFFLILRQIDDINGNYYYYMYARCWRLVMAV